MHEVATARRLRFIQLTQKCHVIFLLPPAASVLILVRPNDDIGLTASDDVSHFITCRVRAEVLSSALADELDTPFNVLFSTFAILIVFSRCPSSASCVVTATVVFPEILLGARCSVMLDCSPLTARGSLFFVILLLLSDRE